MANFNFAEENRFILAEERTFLRKVVADLVSRGCLDARRVYSTGFSGGARMSSALACHASDVVAAVPGDCAHGRCSSVWVLDAGGPVG